MTPLDQKLNRERLERYGIDKLDFQQLPNTKPNYDDVMENKSTLHLHEANRREFLKEKYKIRGNSLEFDGLLGYRLEHSQAIAKSDTHFTSTASYLGKPDGLSVTISKV